MYVRFLHQRRLLFSTALLLLFIVSACSSPVLQEHTRVMLQEKPTAMPAPISLAPYEQPCTIAACKSTVPGQTTSTHINTTSSTTASSNFAWGPHLIDTWDNVHLFLTFTYNISDPGSIAKYYDFVWGPQAYHVAALRANNPKMLITYYIPFNRDAGTYSDPTVGQQHNLSYWQNSHPDWVLYQCDRSTPAFVDNSPDMPLDFSNPAVVNWQVQSYAMPASQNGYDALATDNVNLENVNGACGFYHNGQWVQRYTGQMDDSQWQSDVLSWMTNLQAALHALPHPMALIPNLDLQPVSPSAPFAQQVASHIDGIADEGGFTQYGHGYLTDNQWVQMIQFIRSFQNQGKPYYSLNEFSSGIGSSQIMWAISSYLMAKEHLSAIFISGGQQYGYDLRHPEYNIQIGSPLNEMYSAQNVYWRNYTGGLVVVNPSGSSSYTVTSNSANYVDPYGNHVNQTFTLAPHSGMILLGH